MGNFLFDSDYGSLSAALTAAAGRVLVISQNHTISAPETVPANTHLFGDGGSITIDVDDENVLEIGGNGVTIEGIEIVGTASTPPAEPNVKMGNGIFAEEREDLTVKDCVIHGFNICGILLLGCRDASLRGNRLYGNVGGTIQADICTYSSTPPGGRVCIEGNFCLSNNSSGIVIDALGYDNDVSVLGNICVTTDDGGDETTTGYVRRHGIMVGYNSPVAGNGRLAVIGNICRNTQWTGIYVATSTTLRRGVVISNNVCSRNGIDENTGIAGGIYINVGGAGTLIANNAVYDFLGSAAQYTGSLVVNHTIAGASATLIGNVCDTSTAYGIMLKSRASGTQVIANRTYAIAYSDVVEIPTPGEAGYGGNRIERNEFVRTNADHGAIAIVAQDSTQTTYVLDNAITGFDKNDSDDANVGILVSGGVGTKPVVATGNVVRNFHKGIVNYGYITGRYESLLRFDRNEFVACSTGIVLGATSEAAAMVVEGNRFVGVATPLSGSGGGLGGYSVGYVGRRDGDRLVLLGLNAAPGVGTWAVGDRAEFTAPSAGGNIGAVCTTAGNAGTWKAYGAIAA